MIGLVYLERPADFIRQLDARIRAAAGARALYRSFQENSPLIVVKVRKPAGRAKAKTGGAE